MLHMYANFKDGNAFEKKQNQHWLYGEKHFWYLSSDFVVI